MQLISIAIGKLVFWLLRLFGRTGSALPGLIIEKLNPYFLPQMLRQLPHGVIVVSGTNGKTTTTKISTALLESQGLRVLTNKTGSNFVRGIISVVIDKARWNSELPYDIAIFEQDEAHAVLFARQVRPRGVIVLNVMRDQMDRFGEIDTTRHMLQQLVSAATEWVVLNANDERVSHLKAATSVKTYWYAHSKELQPDFLTDDQLYHAGSAVYHLASEPTVLLTGYTNSDVSLVARKQELHYDYALQGGHNALNLAAAMTMVYAVMPNYDEVQLRQALCQLQPAFGRGEVIVLPSGGTLTLQLVKNPGGFTQALRMLELKPYSVVGIAINDDYPDGRDVSWLWDVDFHGLAEQQTILCGGTRAADMANRLKYDSINATSTHDIIAEYGSALDAAAANTPGEAILFCTYTAMRKLRGLYLGNHSGLDEEDL
jgi:UDP-N-acetylmuramyl tripeptide synthase